MRKNQKPPLKAKNKRKKNARAVAATLRRKMSLPTGRPRHAFTARLSLEMYRDLQRTAAQMDCPVQLVVDTALTNYFEVQKSGGLGRGRGKRRLPVDPLTTVTDAERPLLMSALGLLRSRVVEARGLLVAFLSHWDKLHEKRKETAAAKSPRRQKRQKLQDVTDDIKAA